MMGYGSGDQTIELIVSFGRIDSQSAVLELVSSSANLDGPALMVANVRGKDGIAAVYGVLNVAKDIGQANLVLAPKFLLSRITIRNPNIRSMLAEEVFGNAAGAARGDFVQDCLTRQEHPLSLGHAIGPGFSLV